MERVNRVYLIRHGQVDGYEEFPVYGHTDVDLTETGTLQMQQMAERLRLVEIKGIYASDLKRACSGARFISLYHDAALKFLPDLREMNFGDWEGLSIGEIRRNFPDELERRRQDLVNYRVPGQGESVGRFSERVMTCFEEIRSDQEGNDFVVVAHGGVNRVVICHALGLDLRKMFSIQQDYGCLNIIDYFPDFTLVRLVNG